MRTRRGRLPHRPALLRTVDRSLPPNKCVLIDTPGAPRPPWAALRAASGWGGPRPPNAGRPSGTFGRPKVPKNRQPYGLDPLMSTGEFIFRYEAIVCPPHFCAMGRQRCLLPRSMLVDRFPLGAPKGSLATNPNYLHACTVRTACPSRTDPTAPVGRDDPVQRSLSPHVCARKGLNYP